MILSDCICWYKLGIDSKLICLFRSSDTLSGAKNFFQKYELNSNTCVANVYEIFASTYQSYNAILRASIDKYLSEGSLPQHGNPTYYSYVILDVAKLYSILDRYNSGLATTEICNADFDIFKDCIIYIGKGKNDRKIQHAISGKKFMENILALSGNTDRLSKIAQLWENGNGVAILQLTNEITHYEAHAREFAMIKAMGLDSITNVINGVAYGVMGHGWNDIEVVNYGTMMLYNALKLCILERPRSIMSSDIMLPKPRGRISS